MLLVGAANAEELSPAEQELVQLMDAYGAELDDFWTTAEAMGESEPSFDYRKAIVEGRLRDPNAKYIPQLLDLEQRHRGSDAGLLALLHICRRAGGGGWPDEPHQLGWLEALTRFKPYASKLFLAHVAKRIPAAHYRDQAVECLREIAASPDAPKLVSAAATYNLADTLPKRKSVHEVLVNRLQALNAGETAQWPDEREYLLVRLKFYPNEPALTQGADEAIRLLEKLANDPDSPRMQRVVGIDENYRVMRFAEDPAQPLLSEMAAAKLFRTTVLQPGVEAPPLEVELVRGGRWSLADQKGKVVVIQFSFTGCDPCEAMYPDLAEISESRGEAVSVLTILRDEAPDKALDEIAAGKLTWNIAQDGDPGRVTTKWSVESFPTVFVVDRLGRFSAVNLRSDDLKEEVTKLLE